MMDLHPYVILARNAMLINTKKLPVGLVTLFVNRVLKVRVQLVRHAQPVKSNNQMLSA